MLAATLGVSGGMVLSGASKPQTPRKSAEDLMSPMGRAAANAQRALENLSAGKDLNGSGACVNTPDCENQDDVEGPAETQSETSIAIDSTGTHVVIGFNDFRGFRNNPVSVSGFMYSDDGGETFVDGGQLPTPGNDTIGTVRFPQVLGDPDVKFVSGCTFVYSSILGMKFSSTPAPGRSVQTMGVHRSTDCGHTWTGPFEVTAATNPNGAVNTAGSPRDAADKEFMDVDPDTGRLIMSWSNFTPFARGGVEISTTYSDNILANPPTWSSRQIVAAAAQDGQASIPRFASGGSTNAYIVWQRFPFPGTLFGYGNTVGFARSTDNGATWSAPVDLAPEFFTMDQVLGNDRVNTSPSLAVDNSNGPFSGNIYVVYANNDLQDGADIVFQRSTDLGLTFSEPIRLNSRPGNDRAQWFPWVTVDDSSGRVHVFYYDQGIASSGDLSEVTYTYSDDGGLHWQQPLPVTDRPFHAGWGNDTGQPNLGDYIQAVALNGDLFASFAYSERPPLGFADGQPSTSLTVPDAFFKRFHFKHLKKDEKKFKAPTVNLGPVTFTDSGGNGNIDPGDQVTLTLPLYNYVTNPLNARTVDGIHARLSTTTPGVTIIKDDSPYPKLDPGEIAASKKDFALVIAPSFVPGTFIELQLNVDTSAKEDATLLFTLFTGTPLATTILSEDFDSTAPGLLPAGWTTSHGGGANTVPWMTNNTFCGTGTNAAFHANAKDGPPGGSPARWERLFSPVVIVPADSNYVTLEFDVCFDTEDDPNFNILAYDGFFPRVTDLTTGRTLRSVLVEAFEDEFTTGSLFHFPKHLPRSGNPAYFEDMSAWAGDSHGFQHVRLRLPGMGGSTVQLRFEFTQDSSLSCADVRPGHACGVMFDNLVMKSVVLTTP
jgi:hypothetical protein